MTKETYKNVRKNQFTQVSNKMLWDKNLTLEAKGLLSIFLSNSNEWELNMKEIINRSKNGRDKHYATVKELIKSGYFARVEIRKGGKFEELIYIFSDAKSDVKEELKGYEQVDGAFINPDKSKKPPLTENQETAEESLKPPFTENPDTVKPDTAEPHTESQNINNTNINNTNLNNINLNNIKESVSQSINILYDEKSIPISILQIMNKNIDRLTEDKIHPISIKVFYETYSEHKLNDPDFAFILEKVLTQTKDKIKNFNAIMKRAAQNFYDEYEE